MRFFPCLWILQVLLCGSCSLFESSTAILWTDEREFALYAGYFNAAQDRFKVETRYFEAPAQKLTETGANPDLVVGSWLKSASTRNLFAPLDRFLRRNRDLEDSFYPHLLALGSIEGRQYLLPVSFNIPALVFAQGQSPELSNPFTIGLEEIKDKGRAYNAESGGVYTRLGFSPAWDRGFLYLTAVLFNASFREAAPLAWDGEALERAIAYIRVWIDEANSGIQAEDDFSYKYLYEPPPRLVRSGRILFAYMDSFRFFTLAPELRESLDFRWITGGEGGSPAEFIPLDEGAVFYGIAKTSRAQRAAEAFTLWFFQTETQRFIMEEKKNKRISENSFGIGGGFSALRTVTEGIFPLFYPGLLGHIPPESSLSPPNILPRNWVSLKERVLLPYLHDRIRLREGDEIRSLERRIGDWSRLNQGFGTGSPAP
jgi:ABC-type glycerol-3-phosphate transport system substrate-binding protein